MTGTSATGVEFFTKVTNDIFLKHFWARVKFSRIDATKLKFGKFRLEFSQNNWSEFVFE